MIPRPAVFLARDGVLLEPWFDEQSQSFGSPLWPEHLVMTRQAAPFVRALNGLGYLVLVVSNQPAMARCELTPMRLDRIHRLLREELARGGAAVDGIFFCPHDPEGDRRRRPDLARSCRCRMPAPGLILEAASVHKVDLSRSLLVAGGLAEVEAGRAAGLTTVLHREPTAADRERFASRPESRPDHAVAGLTAVWRAIRGERDRMLADWGG